MDIFYFGIDSAHGVHARRLGLQGSFCVLLTGLMTACPTPEVDELEPLAVGTLVGEVFIEDPDLQSVEGAKISVLGTSARATSKADKKFVLQSIPVGKHTVRIVSPDGSHSLQFETSVSTAFQTVTLSDEQTTLKEAGVLTGTVALGDGADPVGTMVYLVNGGPEQTTTAGSNGTFTLPSLPIGTVSIGFSRDGYDTHVVELDVSSGENTLDETVNLPASTVSNLSLAGSFQRVGETEHQGTNILLNGGQQVASTNAQGAYRFQNLTPGVYTLQAQSPGFQTVEIPSVALSEDGSVDGVTDGYLSPGSDNEDAAETETSLVVVSPVSNQVFTQGSTMTFLAELNPADAQVDLSGVAWAIQRQDQSDAPVEELGTGNPLSTDSLDVGSYLLTASYENLEVSSVFSVSAPNLEETQVDIDILSPVNGNAYETGAITFDAQVFSPDLSIGDDQIQWSREDPTNAADTEVLGTGATLIVDTLSPGSHRISVDITGFSVTLPTQSVLIEVIPYDYQLSLDISTVGINSAEDTIYAGTDVTLSATYGFRDGLTFDPDTDLSWSYHLASEPSTSVSLGTGGLITTASLPVGVVEVEATMQVSDGEASLTKTLPLVIEPVVFDPVLNPPSVDAELILLNIEVPTPETITLNEGTPEEINVSQYTIAQGTPVFLKASASHPIEGDLSDGIVWTSLDLPTTVGPSLNASAAPEGTHDIYLSVTAGSGASATGQMRLVVEPFEATLSITSPISSPADPYLEGEELALVAELTHPYQSSFPSSKVRWLNEDRVLVANGFDTRSFNLPAGLNNLTLEVEDAVGNIISDTVQFVVQDFIFDVAFDDPIVGEVAILEDETLTLQSHIDYSLDSTDLTILYVSSIDGILADALSETSFASGDSAVFDGLTIGTHTITAQASDGLRSAEASIIVHVQEIGITAAVYSPGGGNVYFAGYQGNPNYVDGDTISFSASGEGNVTGGLEYRWYLDGVEFQSDWGGHDGSAPYGTDAAAESRQAINFGPYEPDDPATMFNSAPWAPGQHTVRFIVSAAGADLSNIASTCVDEPGVAVCIERSFQTASSDSNISTDLTIGAGEVETWSGVVNLVSDVFISGTLHILPGTQVIVDADVGINVSENGTLLIGSENATEDVIIEAQGALAAPGRWQGIQLENGDGTETIHINHAQIRHMDYGLVALYHYQYSGFDASDDIQLRHVLFEEIKERGIQRLIPSVMDDVTIRNVGDRGVYEYDANYHPPEIVRHRLTIENARYGYAPSPNAVTTLIDPTFRNMTDYGIIPSGELFIRGGLFEDNNGGNQSAGIRQGYDSSTPDGYHKFKVERSVFRNNRYGIYSGNMNTPTGEATYEVYGNIFEGNTWAILDNNVNTDEINVHLNVFLDNQTHVYVSDHNDPNGGAEIDALGNYMGDFADIGSSAGAAHTVEPGNLVNMPHITDYLDTNNHQHRFVRADNFLSADSFLSGDLSIPGYEPVAFIDHPRRGERYRSDTCIPLSIEAPLREVDPANCTWYLSALDADPVTGTILDQVDGCAQGIGEGTHQIGLECTDAENITTVVSTEIVVNDSRISGPLLDGDTTWSGDVLVDGDVIVPFGTTLTIAAGSRIYFSLTDHRHDAYFPIWTGNNYHSNAYFGSRGKVELRVEGELIVEGTESEKVIFAPANPPPVPVAYRWEGFRPTRGASLNLQHVQITGTSSAILGEYNGDDWTDRPLVYLSHVDIQGASYGITNICPETFQHVTIEAAKRALYYAHCYADLTITDSTFRHLTPDDNGDFLLAIMPWDSNSISPAVITLDRVTFEGIVGSTNGIGLGTFFPSGNATFSDILIRDSEFRNIKAVVDMRTGGTASHYNTTIENSLIENTEQVIWQDYNHSMTQLTLNQVLVRNTGNYYHYDRRPERVMITGLHSIDTGRVVWSNLDAAAETFVEITGSQFENSTNPFYFETSRIDGDLTVNLNGNNFIDIQGEVIQIQSNLNNAGDVATFDMSNSYWGTSEPAEIQALIDDPRAVTQPAGDFVGAVEYTGYSADPLLLDLYEE